MDKLKLYSVVEKLIQKGQTDKALESLEQILKFDPADLKALNRAADLYLKDSRFDKAVDCLKRIGAAFSKDGFYSKAVAIYKRILKIEGVGSKADIIAIHEHLAVLYGHLGLVSDAMGHFSIVVDFYDQTGDQGALLEVLKKVSELDPSNIESQLKLVELSLAQKQIAEATEAYGRLLESVQGRKSPSDLVRVLERGVELFPQDLERLKALVDAYVGAGEPKKALAQIQVAFRASPRNPDVLEMLSSTFLALKQPDKSKAVDVELVKLYRQKGDTEKAAGVESRIQGSALQAKASEKEHQAPQPEDIQDPIESLIKALPLTADEKKVLSECEVYFKYGLVEKAHEVLKNRLSQFPQSLILRWKMKAAAQELKKMDETAHLLSEIILLAKTQKLEIWSNLAATELQALDPNHPSLSGNSKAPNPKASEAPIPAPKKDSPVSLAGDVRANAPAKKVAEADDFSFEGSEVSIVIDDELSVDADFSDISLQDLSSPTPKKTEETTFELEESAASEPEAKEAPSEELDSSSDSILSESDFTAEELDQLGMQLAPDEPKVEMKFDENTVNADDIVLPENPPHEPAPSVVESQKAPVASMSSDDATSPIEIEIRMDEGDDDGTKLELSDGPEVMDGADFEIRQGLEEIQFFRSQGLIDEADSLLQTLKTKFPHHPEWTASPLAQDAKAKGHGAAESSAKKVLEVETLGRKMKLSVEEDNRSESEGDFYDLAGELDQELSAPETATTTEVKEVFSAFKKGVAAAVSEEDWQTHFDLGVAYREMGLHEDAIAEFKIVSKAHGQKISALYQMGVTRTMQEKYEDARNFFDQALKEPGLGGHEKLSVSYELGEVLLKLNDKAKAKKLFEDVKKMDPEFREVKEKIRAAG